MLSDAASEKPWILFIQLLENMGINNKVVLDHH